ncbi:ESX-1 secretion-associated protein [Actinoplanes hulinensis]|uniref:ESX-1 secretion-associated protein n=1 Tax=Actinoplanes hulinensis TaxID=1144547 RepID=A0ABS7BEW1_9ACTN|nr:MULTISPECIES: type VII secretion target [Actinoplanes]MBW6439412.1 ESX-1 secretion-associated protein [Actinoplanes hulinensis]GGM98050.1 hypothetical protein GCM10010109_02140 [Actinoplanes campanulatus]GID34251.1 hypothetical protein Aca09nite_07570 [Actinoplanes campanulatus]
MGEAVVDRGNDAVSVTPADLISHAGHIGVIADVLGDVGQASEAVRLGAQAYGELCALVPGMLNGLHDALADGIRVAEESLLGSAARVRATGERYAAADVAAARRAGS